MITGKGPFVDGLISGGSGEWCWNSSYGCGPQITGLKFIGLVVLGIVVISFIMQRLTK